MTKHLLIIIIFFTSTSLIFAQDSTKVVTKRTYRAMPLDAGQALIVDGLLEDRGWEVAEWTTDFIEWEPDENTPPSQQTKFKIVYDKKFLYVAFRCYDTEPEKIEKDYLGEMILLGTGSLF